MGLTGLLGPCGRIHKPKEKLKNLGRSIDLYPQTKNHLPGFFRVSSGILPGKPAQKWETGLPLKLDKKGNGWKSKHTNTGFVTPIKSQVSWLCAR